MPAANSEGYYRLKRTEKYNGIEYDPNRDFPYDNSPDNCLNTLAGRSLVRVIADHMFVIGITFHGGTSSISYPWGSYNHAIKDKSEEAPDDYSMKQVAEMLREVAGSYPSKYIVGPMTDTVYAVNGGLEDWAYAASWAKDIENNRIIDICNSEENKKSGSKIIINGDNVRFPLYLIETAHQKYPREKAWGNITGVENFGKNNSGNGHVSRNIRVSMALIDMAMPYIRDVKIYYKNERQIKIKWKVGGALYVNKTYIEIFDACKKDTNQTYFWNDNSTIVSGCSQILLTSGSLEGPGYWTNSSASFTINMPAKMFKSDNYGFRIAAITDQQWSLQSNPKPKFPPLTHFARMRIEDNYYASSGSSVINVGKIFYSPVIRPLSIPLLNETNDNEIKEENELKINLFLAIFFCLIALGFVMCLKHCLYGKKEYTYSNTVQTKSRANSEFPSIQIK